METIKKLGVTYTCKIDNIDQEVTDELIRKYIKDKTFRLWSTVPGMCLYTGILFEDDKGERSILTLTPHVDYKVYSVGEVVINKYLHLSVEDAIKNKYKGYFNNLPLEVENKIKKSICKHFDD